MIDIYAFIVSVDDLQCKIICSKSICNDILYPAANLPTCGQIRQGFQMTHAAFHLNSQTLVKTRFSCDRHLDNYI